MAELSESGPGAETRDAWREKIARVDRTGDVYVSLSSGSRSLLVLLSPPGVRSRVLARTKMGDVSYTDIRGMTEGEAAAVARAWARRLEEGRSSVSHEFARLARAGDAEGGEPGPVASRAPHDAEDPALQIHRFALLTSGYTVIRGAFSADEVAALGGEVDRALEATRKVIGVGRELAYTFYDGATYIGTRCIYCWGDACRGLVENDLVERVSQAVIGPHKLFDMTAHCALPASGFGRERLEGWHRDVDVSADSPPNVRYLWFFVYLDDFTAENGATWIVPGTQRIPNDRVPDERLGADRFPTQVQLLGRAGDVVVINPSALHSVGYNTTDRPRRMINVSVCHAEVRPLLDHWAIAGPAVHERASDRLRHMLGAEGEWPLDTTWTVLPEGWQTSERSREGARDPASRVLPLEQQGYQRSHRKR